MFLFHSRQKVVVWIPSSTISPSSCNEKRKPTGFNQETSWAGKYPHLCWRVGWGIDVIIIVTHWNTYILRLKRTLFVICYLFFIIPIVLFIIFYPVTRYCVTRYCITLFCLVTPIFAEDRLSSTQIDTYFNFWNALHCSKPALATTVYKAQVLTLLGRLGSYTTHMERCIHSSLEPFSFDLKLINW